MHKTLGFTTHLYLPCDSIYPHMYLAEVLNIRRVDNNFVLYSFRSTNDRPFEIEMSKLNKKFIRNQL